MEQPRPNVKLLRPPWWAPRVDAWFKLLGTIVLAYLIVTRLFAVLAAYEDVTIVAVGGMLIAYLVLPLVRALNVRLPLWAALTVVYGAIAVLIALAIYVLVPVVAQQVHDLIAGLPAMRATTERYLSTTNNPLITHLPVELRSYAQKIPLQLSAEAARVTARFSSAVLPAVLSLVGIGALFVAIPVVSIYMLAESTMFKRFLARMIPPSRRESAMDLLAEIDAVIGGFVRGQLIVAAVVAGLATGALLLLHVPFAFLIGIWAGIADVVPYVGPFAGGIPALFVALVANGWLNAVLVGAAFVVINQIEAHLLGPRIVSSTVKVTPLAVIFALLIGAHVLGFLGLIVAVPLAGIVRVILYRLFPDGEVTNAEIRPGLAQVPLTEVDPMATEA